MPRTAYKFTKKFNQKKLHSLFAYAKQESGITSDELAETMRKSPTAVRMQMTRPDDMWRISEIRRYCELLNVDFNYALSVVGN